MAQGINPPPMLDPVTNATLNSRIYLFLLRSNYLKEIFLLEIAVNPPKIMHIICNKARHDTVITNTVNDTT